MKYSLVDEICKLLWPYIANEDRDEDYSAEGEQHLCEEVLPQVWGKISNIGALLQNRTLAEALVVDRAERVLEGEDWDLASYCLKHLKPSDPPANDAKKGGATG